jgi:uncharacterized phiE125 gp8 family phage protein
VSGLVQTSPPAGEPVTLAEAKAWLRVDGSEENTLITGLIEAARHYVETFTHRALITQQFSLKLDGFPGGGRVHCWRIVKSRGDIIADRVIVLPRPPLASVQSITYIDEDGDEQTFSASAYHVDTASQPGRVVLDSDYDWPDIDDRPNAVSVNYTAGYGTSSSVPQGLRTAIRFMVTHWFTNRTPVNIGNIVNTIPESAEALLWQYRIPSAY